MKIEDTMKVLKEEGARLVGCLPLYPPLELIHSLGLTPVLLWDLKQSVPNLEHADLRLQVYACSIARHLTEFVLADGGRMLDGLFMYNACDTLRNLPEIISCGLAERNLALPIVKTHLPMAPEDQTDTADYLRRKIRALIRELETSFGVTFSPPAFRRSVDLYGRMRRLCRDMETAVAKGDVGYGDFCLTIREGHFRPVEDQIAALEKVLGEVPSAAGTGRKHSLPVVVSGILPPPPALVEAIEGSGLTIVANDVATQSRSYGYAPEGLYDVEDYYLDFYRSHVPCPTLLYTADRRVVHLREMVTDTGAAGFIFLGEKFCECEFFEMPYVERILREAGLSVLSLEMAIDDNENCAPFLTRIEAFAELLAMADQKRKGGGHV